MLELRRHLTSDNDGDGDGDYEYESASSAATAALASDVAHVAALVIRTAVHLEEVEGDLRGTLGGT